MKKIEKFYMIVGLCLFLGWFGFAVVGFKILRTYRTQNSINYPCYHTNYK